MLLHLIALNLARVNVSGARGASFSLGARSSLPPSPLVHVNTSSKSFDDGDSLDIELTFDDFCTILLRRDDDCFCA